jgi:hypothetical protein
MAVDGNVFFREATLRICSSSDIVEALMSCFDYVCPKQYSSFLTSAMIDDNEEALLRIFRKPTLSPP